MWAGDGRALSQRFGMCMRKESRSKRKEKGKERRKMEGRSQRMAGRRWAVRVLWCLRWQSGKVTHKKKENKSQE